MNISNGLKKRFVKDQNLPIQLVQEPYFSYFLELYNPFYKTLDKYKDFIKTVQNFKDEESFFSEAHKFSQYVINYISEKQVYKDFSNDPLKNYDIKDFVTIQKLYHKDNTNKNFISIDLKKANFQALNFYNPEITNFKNNYFDFLESIYKTDNYFYQSKQIRQVIFGNLNPKKQQKIQKYIMSCIMNTLIENGIHKEDIFSSSADEIIIASDNITSIKKILKENNTYSFVFHINKFCLKQIHPNHNFFVKELDDESVEFKNIPSFNMAECIKYYTKQPIQKEDLTFFHEGRIACFLESLLV